MAALRSGLLPEQRTAIRQSLVRLTEEYARSFGCTAEAVVQEIRYWQQSNADWRTNPRRADKLKSFKHYEGVCQAPECGKKIDEFDEATFHHFKRGIPKVHSPENMVPLHKFGGCHERLHNAKGSFTAGSLSRLRAEVSGNDGVVRKP